MLKIESKQRRRKYTLTEADYYLGENVKIGKKAFIEPLYLIGHDVIIGDNVTTFSGAKIKNATIGNDCITAKNAVIGGYGFTMAEDENGNKFRMPTFGKVVIATALRWGN